MKLKLYARLALTLLCVWLYLIVWANGQRKSANETAPGFDDVVFAISFSPDGRTLAIARGANEPAQRFGRIELWDTETQQLRHVIKGFDGPVRSVSFSPDGKTLVSGSTEFSTSKIKDKVRSRQGDVFGELKWWDPETGELKHKLTLPGDNNYSLLATWSPDGKQLAIEETYQQFSFYFNNNGTFSAVRAGNVPADNPSFLHRPAINQSAYLRLLDAQTGEPTLKLKTNVPRDATFSPDGMLLAAEDGGEVKVWNTRTGQEEHKLKGFKGRPNALAFSPDGKSLAVAASKLEQKSSGRFTKMIADSEVKVFDVRSWTATITLQNLGAVNSLVFEPSGRFLLIAGLLDQQKGNLPAVRLHDLQTGKTATFPTGEDFSQAVDDLTISSNGRLLAFRAGNEVVRLLDMRTWEFKQTLDSRSAGTDNQRSVSRFLMSVNRVTALAFLPDGKTLSAEIEGRGASLWDTRTGELKKRVEDRDSGSSLVAISPNGAALATGGEDTDLRFWNLAEGKKNVISHPGDSISALALSTEGHLMAAASGRELVVLDVPSGNKLLTLSGQPSTITGLVFSSDDQTLASVDESGTIKLWEPKTGLSKGSVKASGKVIAMRFAPGGQVLASTGEDKTISLWDLRTGSLQMKLRKHDGAINAIAFSPDGQLLASGSDDRTVIIWETASGKPRRTLKGQEQTVLSLAFSPDGSLIASGGGNASVVLWEVRTGKVNRVLR